MTDYPELLRLLTEHGVEFIIIGGAAAVIHGSSRLTHLEVVYRRSPENLARLTNALKAQAPYLRGAPPGLPFQLQNWRRFWKNVKSAERRAPPARWSFSYQSLS